MRVLTIGHSRRTFQEFVDLLRAHGATHLVDIRTAPRSRQVPWTNIETLPMALAPHGVGHTHLAGLGGLRKPRPDSPNLGWRNESFRGYADHMATPAFQRDLERLMALAREGTPAIMCAEAVPWRCHRNLVADALVVRGVEVLHIMDGGLKPHALAPFARVEDGRLTYPPPGGVQQRLPE